MLTKICAVIANEAIHSVDSTGDRVQEMDRRFAKNAPRDDEIVRPIKQTTTNYRVFINKILRCHRERSEAIHCTAETGDRAQEMDHRVAKKLLAMTAPSGC